MDITDYLHEVAGSTVRIWGTDTQSGHLHLEFGIPISNSCIACVVLEFFGLVLVFVLYLFCVCFVSGLACVWFGLEFGLGLLALSLGLRFGFWFCFELGLGFGFGFGL